MNSNRQENWYPIEKLSMFETMIAGEIEDTEDNYKTFMQARENPHVLDDSIIDRAIRLYTERLEYIDHEERQIARWKKGSLTPKQQGGVDALSFRTRYNRDITEKLLVLVKELREGTIDRILEMDDNELALHVLSGKIKPPIGRNKSPTERETKENLSEEQANNIASEINEKFLELESRGFKKTEILGKMNDLMPKFKTLLDSGQLNHFCDRFNGLYRFSKMLEKLAAGIASGDIKVP